MAIRILAKLLGLIMNRKQLRTLGLGVFAVFAATVVSFLSFISVELAMAVFALSSVGFIVMLERSRRANWEQAADFKFKHMRKKHDALSRDVDRQRLDIDALTKQARKGSVSFKTIAKQDDVVEKPKPLKAMKPLKKPTSKLPAQELTKPKPKMRIIEDGDSLSDMVVEELTGHAIRKQRIDIFIQPIVRLPQRQRRFYEIFSRVRAKSGVYIPAKRYLDIAEKNDQIQDIDSILLSQCLILLLASSNAPNAPSFFVNITARTLKNKQFMGKLLAFLSKNRGLAERLVFEMKQSEFHDLPIPVLKIVSGLAKLGCSFSLDHVTSLEEDIADLHRFNVRYLKASADMFTTAVNDERQFKASMKAKRVLEGNGVGLIVEKIEDEVMMRSLLDYDFSYGQGYLFGRPDLQGAYEPDLRVKHA